MDNTPKTLEEAVEILTNDNIDSIEEIKGMGEDDFLARAHHGLGRNLRNAWGLWFNDEPLSQWFNSLGIVHGDDRSSIILTSFYRSLLEMDFDVDKQVEHYKDFWRKQGFKDGIPTTK